jgi:hypothetical protein
MAAVGLRISGAARDSFIYLRGLIATDTQAVQKVDCGVCGAVNCRVTYGMQTLVR